MHVEKDWGKSELEQSDKLFPEPDEEVVGLGRGSLLDHRGCGFHVLGSLVEELHAGNSAIRSAGETGVLLHAAHHGIQHRFQGVELVSVQRAVFITVGNYGGGSYTPDSNLAEWIDRTVLGRFRDGATVENGEVIFATWYRYTWILSSLNFGVTVLTGLFAGYILKNKLYSERLKLRMLFGIGLGMVIAGWLWGIELPVIKKLWTSSMVLVSSGYCFLLMGLFYYWIDYKGHRKYTTWLKVYGMNSILA